MSLSLGEIRKWSPEEVITFIKAKKNDLFLKENQIKVLEDQEVAGLDFLRLSQEDLERWGIPGGPAKRIIESVKEINEGRLLSLEEALSYIPPTLKCVSKPKPTIPVIGIIPKKILLWNDFFDKVNNYNFDRQQLKFEKPQFGYYQSIYDEFSVRCAVHVNINQVLNLLLGSNYWFSSDRSDRSSRVQPDFSSYYKGKQDFTCYYKGEEEDNMIMVIDIKRNQGLMDIGEKTLPEFCAENEEAKIAIHQIYNYMLFNALKYERLDEEQLTFGDFKFLSILGTGGCGSTKLAEFRGTLIALKSIDLYKQSNLLGEMKNEVEIYKILIDIQGKYIPRLVCYGYYSGFSYVIGTTLAGSSLEGKHITTQQKDMAIDGLNAIHEHGILHKSIHEGNVLLNEDTGDIFIIDFGKSGQVDLNKKNEKFENELKELTYMLDESL
ncbi:8235_t:CDS:2 [Diversispora eburnea]|uniref:8235_t:CDS:1 n=1 Tax=Diversispora eburnea TaxID=1213867 RepID=A0A9N9FGK4_9GLOM|nr:8235_t:CDS:2 [Diversispora eburnea]